VIVPLLDLLVCDPSVVPVSKLRALAGVGIALPCARRLPWFIAFLAGALRPLAANPTADSPGEESTLSLGEIRAILRSGRPELRELNDAHRRSLLAAGRAQLRNRDFDEAKRLEQRVGRDLEAFDRRRDKRRKPVPSNLSKEDKNASELKRAEYTARSQLGAELAAFGKRMTLQSAEFYVAVAGKIKVSLARRDVDPEDRKLLLAWRKTLGSEHEKLASAWSPPPARAPLTREIREAADDARGAVLRENRSLFIAGLKRSATHLKAALTIF
jgi:hypothetical protein